MFNPSKRRVRVIYLKTGDTVTVLADKRATWIAKEIAIKILKSKVLAGCVPTDEVRTYEEDEDGIIHDPLNPGEIMGKSGW